MPSYKQLLKRLVVEVMDFLPENWFNSLYISPRIGYVYLLYNGYLYDLMYVRVTLNGKATADDMDILAPIKIYQVPDDGRYNWLVREFNKSLWGEIDV